MAIQMSIFLLFAVTVTVMLRNGLASKSCRTTENLMTYNPKTQVCCNGTVSQKMNSMSCCNGADEMYDENNFLCCGNETYPIRDSRGNARTCCEGHLYNSTENMDCCGESQYNTTTHICCEKKAFKRTKGMDCCLSEAYNPDNHRCVDSRVILVTQDICGEAVYNTTNMKCCDNQVLHNISIIKYPADCCGTQLYSTLTQQCCPGTDFRAPTNEECCGQGSINTSLYICCNGVSRSRSSAELACCRTQTFDKNHEGCCGGTIYNKTDQQCCGDKNIAQLNHKCCGKLVFNPMTELCCNKTETPSVISGNSTSLCPQYKPTNSCGTTHWDKKVDQCCNNKVYKNANGKPCSELNDSPRVGNGNHKRTSKQYGLCRVCNRRIPSFLNLIRRGNVSVCGKQAFMLNVNSVEKYKRFWLLDVTSNTEKQRKKEFKLRVLVPCKCSQLGNTSAQYLLLTHSAVMPERLLRLGDNDFLLPRKENTSSVIFRMQAKCKISRRQFLEEMKKRMRKRADKIFYELLRLKIR